MSWSWTRHYIIIFDFIKYLGLTSQIIQFSNIYLYAIPRKRLTIPTSSILSANIVVNGWQIAIDNLKHQPGVALKIARRLLPILMHEGRIMRRVE